MLAIDLQFRANLHLCGIFAKNHNIVQYCRLRSNLGPTEQ